MDIHQQLVIRFEVAFLFVLTFDQHFILNVYRYVDLDKLLGVFQLHVIFSKTKK